MLLTPGTRLGPYEILAPIGAGGMGEVYRARDTRLQRDVAVKVILAENSRDPEHILRFEHEARAAGALSHPNVCAILDVGTHDESPFVVMELLEGESLRAKLAAGAIPLRKALEYGAQAAEGLSAAHAKGIVHRDLKPENLFVTREGRVKVLDFGLAKLKRREGLATPGETVVSLAATGDGAILGTSAYMSPEQIRGEPVDDRTDVFALGVVLHEMLTGEMPFRGATAIEVMSAILHQDPAPLATLRPDAPPYLARILRRCLAKDPERRIQTSKDLRNELEDVLHELGLASPGDPSAEKPQGQPVERQFVLTAEHVRQLEVRNPRLIGFPMFYLDNQVESETLVVLLHGLGGDYRRFEPALRALPCRAVSVSLPGFAEGDTHRPVIGMEDHSRLLRILLKDLVREQRPVTTILVGHSAGADQYLRMIDSEEGAGVDVDALIALGPNVSLDTCFVSRLYTALDAANPEAILDTLKSLGANTRPLSAWLVVQGYLCNTFMKFGSDLAPLKHYAAEVVAPFERPGEPLADWYRAAKAQLRCVRLVFSDQEAGPAEALLARHLEQNVLGDEFSEDSYLIEPVHHAALLEAGLVRRHVESVLGQLAAKA